MKWSYLLAGFSTGIIFDDKGSFQEFSFSMRILRWRNLLELTTCMQTTSFDFFSETPCIFQGLRVEYLKVKDKKVFTFTPLALIVVLVTVVVRGGVSNRVGWRRSVKSCVRLARL